MKVLCYLEIYLYSISSFVSILTFKRYAIQFSNLISYEELNRLCLTLVNIFSSSVNIQT